MLARRLLAIVLLVSWLPVSRADDSSIARLHKDLEYLTSDECEGRGAQTQGLNKAALYIAAEFERIGLKPGGTNRYFQPYTMRAGKAILGSTNTLTLLGPNGEKLALGLETEFQPLAYSGVGSASAPLVFAGYGISYAGTPSAGSGAGKNAATPAQDAYDDYAGLDVAGKIVVVLRKCPPLGKDGKLFGGSKRINNELSSFTSKLLTAAKHKASGVLFVNDQETAEKSDTFLSFDTGAWSEPPVDFPCAQINRDQLDQLLRKSNDVDLESLEKKIRADVAPRSMEMKGWGAQLHVEIDRPRVEVKNVIGILDGKGALANEYVVIGAHYDHLGRGEPGSMESDEKKKRDFHRGADDNGSGTVSILELARRFMADTRSDRRTIVFMSFSGEEQGLLGSRYFCEHPTIPLAKVAAMLNLDMVGRLAPEEGKKEGKLEIGGLGSAKEFIPMVEELNKKYGFQISQTISAFGPSDHTSFAEKNIPVYFLFTGLHSDYHRPSDTIDKINFEGMRQIVDFSQELARRLAIMPKPAYVETSRPVVGDVTDVPRIGFMPGNYDEATKKGVLVGGVTAGRPAAKSGMKKGDYIVEIAGKPIKNMSGYMTAMATLSKGQTVEFVVMRDGNRIKLKVVLE